MIVDEKRLVEIKEQWMKDWGAIDRDDVWCMVETIEALWKVARIAEPMREASSSLDEAMAALDQEEK